MSEDLVPFAIWKEIFVVVGLTDVDPVPLKVSVRGDDCLQVFTDTDLAAAELRESGLMDTAKVLRIDSPQEIVRFLESRPRDEFTHVVFDLTKGRSRWEVTREAMLVQAKIRC